MEVVLADRAGPKVAQTALDGSLGRPNFNLSGGARAFVFSPTAPPMSVHRVVSVADQGFTPGLSLPEAQGPTPSPAVRSAVFMSPAPVPLQLTPTQQPLQEAHGPSACSVAASNDRTRSMHA